jgi:ABC-type Fe3+-hydroxamate transport system substrate-binding protein
MPLDKTKSIKDMMGRSLKLNGPPKRIISLVPSLTELLYTLRLKEKVVGITKFCVHPEEWFNEKVKVGGTKKVNFKIIKELQPDLIIANKEENSEEDIKLLSQLYPVWLSDINSFDDALHAIEWIGEITDTEKEAQKLIFFIHKSWSNLTPFDLRKRTCVYLIWNDPIMLAGNKTYINDILSRINFENLEGENRYPIRSIEELKKLKPEYLFLSSEPFPFNENHRSSYSEILPESKIVLVDGEMFSWYGSRMRAAADYFGDFLNDLDNK